MHKAHNLQSGHQAEDGHHEESLSKHPVVAPVLERADAERISWYLHHAVTMLESKAYEVRLQCGDDNETAKLYDEQARKAQALAIKFVTALLMHDRISAVVDECAGFES